MGQGANVYLASAELAAVASLMGKLPTVDEYLAYAADLQNEKEDTYRYMNFDQLDRYLKNANTVTLSLKQVS